MSDEIWTAVVDVLGELGPVEQVRSRYADKPAIRLNGREIAHCEAPGAIDLRITAAGWRGVSTAFAGDDAVHRDSRRRDWIELHLTGPDDVERIRPLLAATIAANT